MVAPLRSLRSSSLAVVVAMVAVLLAALIGTSTAADARDRPASGPRPPDADGVSNTVIRAVNDGKPPPNGSINSTPAAQLKAQHDKGFQFLYTNESRCSPNDQGAVCRSTIRKAGKTRGTLYLSVGGTSTRGKVTSVKFAFTAS